MAPSDCHHDGRGPLANRRRFLQATSAAGLAGIAGCTGFMGGTEDGVEYWTLFTGGDGNAMESMVSEINESDDHDLSINRQRVPHGEYYDRLYTSLTGDEYPDVAVLHADMINQYEDLVTPLTDDIGADPYVDEIAQAVTVDGELLAAPLDTHPLGLYYNKDIFEEAGLDPESPPTTYAEFEEAANAITENTDYWAVNVFEGELVTMNFRMGLSSLAGEPTPELDENFNPTFNNENGLAVFEELHNWVHEYGWMPDDSEVGDDAWNAGELAMDINGTWHITPTRNNNFEFGVAEPPGMPGSETNFTNQSSHVLVIPRDEDREEARHEEAVETIRLLTQTYSDRWGYEAGHMPASSEALESSELRESDTWNETLEMFSGMIEDGRGVTPPATPNNTAYREHMYQAIDDMRSGNLSPQESLDNSVEGIQETFE
ncbi:extracellular solute-binding protein (plasmid) [Haloferacaceae archaeon DSL9]